MATRETPQPSLGDGHVWRPCLVDGWIPRGSGMVDLHAIGRPTIRARRMSGDAGRVSPEPSPNPSKCFDQDEIECHRPKSAQKQSYFWRGGSNTSLAARNTGMSAPPARTLRPPAPDVPRGDPGVGSQLRGGRPLRRRQPRQLGHGAHARRRRRRRLEDAILRLLGRRRRRDVRHRAADAAERRRRRVALGSGTRGGAIGGRPKAGR